MSTTLNGNNHPTSRRSAPPSRMRPLLRRSLIATLAAGALIGSSYAPAFALDTTPQQVTANVEVGSVITLTGLTTAFTITGVPTDTVDATAPVTYTVTTNNSTGYSVTALSEDTELSPANPGNLDSIPIDALQVFDSTGNFVPMSSTIPVVVGSSGNRSDVAGDDYSTDFQMTIPDVSSDTYTATLDFVASTV